MENRYIKEKISINEGLYFRLGYFENNIIHNYIFGYTSISRQIGIVKVYGIELIKKEWKIDL
jgi:hypothetical protein